MTNKEHAARAALLREMWGNLQLTTLEMGVRLGVSASRVSQLARELELPVRKAAGRRAVLKTESILNAIRTRHAQMMPMREIATEVGVSLRTVARFEKELGLTRPKSGRRFRGDTRYRGPA